MASKKRKRITLDTRESFVLYAGEIRRHTELQEGAFLSDEDYQVIRDKILLPRAKKRALHLLEKQDRTRADVIKKLTQGGYPRDVAEEAADYAASYGYIDDYRYASNYIYFHQEKKSRRRLRDDLLRKGISADTIEICLDEADLTSDEDKIMELLEKKHYDPYACTDKDKARMFRFLVSKGFDTGVVIDVLKRRKIDMSHEG